MRHAVSMTKEALYTSYEEWMRAEGVPIVEAEAGISDVRTLERRPWARMGGRGCFIYLRGLKESGFSGMYVVEIPAGGALEPEKHLYEEMLYVLRGRGAAEIWQDAGPKRTVEWADASLLAPPLNTWHRLFNLGPEPALILGVTTAPIIMDIFHNPEFVFGDGFAFRDRFDGRDSYFNVGDRVERNPGEHAVWDTNFIPDLKNAFVDPRERPKGHNVSIMGFEMADNIFSGHISEWPVGIYHKAHYHGAGAILLGLNSSGYVLLWDSKLGTTPYRDGHEDQVIRVNWGDGAVYAPPADWFHQHFNTGHEAARHIAFRTGGSKYRLGLRTTERNPVVDIKKGGALVEYEDEDPRVRVDFDAALEENGVRGQMPAFRT